MKMIVMKEEVYTHQSLETEDTASSLGHMGRHSGHLEAEGMRPEYGFSWEGTGEVW